LSLGGGKALGLLKRWSVRGGNRWGSADEMPGAVFVSRVHRTREGRGVRAVRCLWAVRRRRRQNRETGPQGRIGGPHAREAAAVRSCPQPQGWRRARKVSWGLLIWTIHANDPARAHRPSGGTFDVVRRRRLNPRSGTLACGSFEDAATSAAHSVFQPAAPAPPSHPCICARCVHTI
jgi:hypothetical protein